MLSEQNYHFSFGNPVWPGTAKLIEECGELTQILAKIMAYPFEPHPDGKDTRARLLDELADVIAATYVFANLNLSDEEREFINDRALGKYSLFQAWHRGEEKYLIDG